MSAKCIDLPHSSLGALGRNARAHLVKCIEGLTCNFGIALDISTQTAVFPAVLQRTKQVTRLGLLKTGEQGLSFKLLLQKFKMEKTLATTFEQTVTCKSPPLKSLSWSPP